MLLNFFDLPIEKQKIFNEIKKVALEVTSQDNEVHIVGSYLSGMWDEKSDYDVVVIGKVIAGSREKIMKKFNFKIDVWISNVYKPEIPSIKIP
jgi:predicted nucleotidyltransferase